MGDPNKAVMALIGNTFALPGSWAMLSEISINIAPMSKLVGIKILWLLVFHTNLQMWGTAKPRKAIGPTNAVILPAIRPVAIRMVKLVFLSEIPRLMA